MHVYEVLSEAAKRNYLKFEWRFEDMKFDFVEHHRVLCNIV